MKENWKYIKRYFRYSWKNGKAGLTFAFFIMMIQSYLSIELPEFLQKIVDLGIMKKSIPLIVKYSVVYIVLMLLYQAITLGMNYFFSTFKIKVASKLKISVIERLARSDGKTVTEQNSGDIIRILDNDMYQLESFGIDSVFELFLSIIVSIVACVVMWRLHPVLLFITFIIHIMLFMIQYYFSKGITTNIKEVRNVAGDQSTLQEEFIVHLKNIILTDVTDYFLKIYSNYQKKLVKRSNKADLLIYTHSGLSGIFSSFSMIITYLVGGIFIVYGEMSMGALVAFSQYCYLLLAPFQNFVSYNVNFKQSAVALEKIYKEMERIHEIEDTGKEMNLKKKIDTLSFNQVSFAYRNKTVLDHFNYTFKKGEITVITGKSGSGKSTLLNLLYRLWKPDQGSILLNGIPIENYKLDFLKKKICIVCQESPIFNCGIRENIVLNQENITSEKLQEVYNIVDIEQLLENGRTLDTPLGENGSQISGGQKQRIALARALVREADILIFDECTSALDNISQQKIIENIQSICKDKIIIIIAHRLAVAKVADCVLVMEHGKKKKKGGYEELMKEDGLFSYLASLKDE